MEKLFQEAARSENPGTSELLLFIDDVATFLRTVVYEKQFLFLWNVDEELQGLASSAMAASVDRASDSLRDRVPQLNVTAASEHGLLGAPLRFKLNVIAALARRWEGLTGVVQYRKWLMQMIAAIDALLDSLIAVAGVGGGMKEFKDALGALALES